MHWKRGVVARLYPESARVRNKEEVGALDATAVGPGSITIIGKSQVSAGITTGGGEKTETQKRKLVH